MNGRPNLAQDRLPSLMKRLSVPGIVGMLMLSVNSLIDSIYLGNLVSEKAFAGVSLLFPLLLLVSSITGMIAAGSASVLSRAIGAQDVVRQRKVLPNLIAMSVVGASVLSLLLWGLSTPALQLLGAEGQVFEHAEAYLLVYVCGIIFNVYGVAANGLIRSEGRIREAMTITGISVVLNLILTPIFIAQLNLGVQGAALSSIASMMVYTVATSWYFIRGKASFATGKFRVRFEREILGEVTSIGMSALTMQLTNVARQFIIFRTITWYGTPHDLAVFSAMFRLFSLVSVPAMGMLQPLQPVLGVNFGAENWARCHQATTLFRRVSTSIMLVALALLCIAPAWVLGWMLPDAGISATEENYVRLVLLALPFLPLSSTTLIFLQAIGKGKKATLIPILRETCLFLPIFLTLPYFFGVTGIYLALLLENVIFGSTLVMLLKPELRALGKQPASFAG